MMNATDNPEPASPVLRAQLKQTGINALIAAGLMLLFGYNSWSGGLSAVEGAPRLYAISVTVFVWTLLIGGASMLLSAMLLFSGWRTALAVDAVFTAVIGVLLLAIGATQLAYVQNLYGVLLLIFGVLFLRSAHVSWSLYRSSARAGVVAEDAVEHPTPVVEYHSDIETVREYEPAPREQAPPPPPAPNSDAPSRSETLDGFLAELGRDDDKERK